MERPPRRDKRVSFAGAIACVSVVFAGFTACVDLDPPWPNVGNGQGGAGQDGGSTGGMAGHRDGAAGEDGAPGSGGSVADASVRVDAEPPGPPVLAVRWHYDGAALQWQASAALVRFRVDRAQGAGTFEPVNDLTAKSWVDDDPVANTKYRYVVEGQTAAGEIFRSNEVTFTRTPNLALNPSFEDGGAATQTPPSWLTWHPADSEPGAAADFTEERLGARSDKFHLTHGSSDKNWTIFTFQQLKMLPPGRYGWRVFARSDGNVKLTKLVLKVCGGDSDLAMTAIPGAVNDWTEYAVEADLEADTCYEAALYTEGARNAWVHFDDAGFYRVEP